MPACPRRPALGRGRPATSANGRRLQMHRPGVAGRVADRVQAESYVHLGPGGSASSAQPRLRRCSRARARAPGNATEADLTSRHANLLPAKAARRLRRRVERDERGRLRQQRERLLAGHAAKARARRRRRGRARRRGSLRRAARQPRRVARRRRSRRRAGLAPRPRPRPAPSTAALPCRRYAGAPRSSTTSALPMLRRAQRLVRRQLALVPEVDVGVGEHRVSCRAARSRSPTREVAGQLDTDRAARRAVVAEDLAVGGRRRRRSRRARRGNASSSRAGRASCRSLSALASRLRQRLPRLRRDTLRQAAVGGVDADLPGEQQQLDRRGSRGCRSRRVWARRRRGSSSAGSSRVGPSSSSGPGRPGRRGRRRGRSPSKASAGAGVDAPPPAAARRRQRARSAAGSRSARRARRQDRRDPARSNQGASVVPGKARPAALRRAPRRQPARGGDERVAGVDLGPAFHSSPGSRTSARRRAAGDPARATVEPALERRGHRARHAGDGAQRS